MRGFIVSLLNHYSKCFFFFDFFFVLILNFFYHLILNFFFIELLYSHDLDCGFGGFNSIDSSFCFLINFF